MMEVHIGVKVKTYNTWLYLSELEEREDPSEWVWNQFKWQYWSFNYSDILKVYKGLE